MRSLVFVLLALASASCVVARPIQARWDCEINADCDMGFSCISFAGGTRICAPNCVDGDCDGDAECTLMTRNPSNPVYACIPRCELSGDGRETVPCPRDFPAREDSQHFHCARRVYPTSGSSSAFGTCVPDATCQRDSDCGEGQCATSLWGMVRSVPNLICLAPQNALSQCPTGWALAYDALGNATCLPTCSETSCPPSMTCYVERGLGFGLGPTQSVCQLGLYGAPCASQADCFVGQCLEVSGRFQCTELCDAASVGNDCSMLSSLAGPLGARLSFSCDADSTGRRVCLAEGGIGHICRDSTDCRAGLRCGSEGYCSAACSRAEECVDESLPAVTNGWCPDGQCRPRLQNESPCTSDAGCVSGLCYTLLVGTSLTRSCSPLRRNGDLCTRNDDCISRVCPAGTFPRLCRGS